VKIIQIQPGFCLLAAILVLVVPFQWVFGAFTAAMVHELSHCLAIMLLGKRIFSVTVGFNGVKIVSEPLFPYQELICAAAGPLSGFALLPLSRYIPYAAVCAFVQSVYNLLPVYPLDGGRCLRCILNYLLPVQARIHAEKSVRLFIAVFLATGAVAVSLFAEAQYILLIGTAVLLCKMYSQKLLAKIAL